MKIRFYDITVVYGVIYMNSKPTQISFMEFLLSGHTNYDDTLGEIVFPKGFEVRDLENLRNEFENLANRYGLSLPAKLKKGNLVLEWKLLPGEYVEKKVNSIVNSELRTKFSKLTSEELNAFSNSFENI